MQTRSLAASIAALLTAIVPALSQAPQVLTIPQIQGHSTASTYAGQLARTTGIVTARVSDGFFLQDPAPDTDPLSSKGLFVFTSITPASTAAIGNLVQVTGTVSEFRRAAAPHGPSMTELTGPATTVLSTGNPLPAPHALSPADLTATGGPAQLERFEGMRVSLPSITAVAPTGGTVDERNATANTNGYFYAVITGTTRPFREPGVPVGDPDPVIPSPVIPRFDGNPEMFGVDSGAQTGTSPVDVATGALMTGVTGVLHQDYGEYRLLPDRTLVPTGSLSASPLPAELPGELRIASFNLERFYDTTDAPSISDVALTADALARRLNKASLAIRNVLGSPDVLAVAEMENLAVLQALAAKIDTDAASAGQPAPKYRACLVEGNDGTGIDVGFLYSSRITLKDCVQYGKLTLWIVPALETSALLNDRPPLVLRGSATAPGSDSSYPFTVVVNHLRSLINIDDPEGGDFVRAKRNAQAEFLATLLEGRQDENTLSVGDYNAYEFNDGYVDVMGTVKGSPTPANQVFLAGAALVDPPYTDLVDTASQGARYSYVFVGNAMNLDHIVVNRRVLPRVTRFAVAHLDADFPEVYRSDGNRPERVSDHDALVAYVRLPVEVTSHVHIRVNRRYAVSLTNTGSTALPSPMYLVFDGLDPAALLNASGVTPEGAPYITVDRALAPGARALVSLRFGAAPGKYTAKVYSAW